MKVPAVLAVHPAIPYPRAWAWVLPLPLLPAASGWNELVSRLSPGPRRWAPAAPLLAAALLGASLSSRNAVAAYPDTGTFAEAERVAAFLRPMLSEKDRVRAFIPADWPTDFYLWRRGADFGLLRSAGEGGTDYFVVKKSVHSIRDLTAGRVERIFNFADAAVYRAIEPETPSVR